MLKKVGLKELISITKEKRLTIAVFYSKRCPECVKQIESLKEIYKKLKDYGVMVVRVDVQQFKKDISKLPENSSVKVWSIDVVPTIMMWVRGGINVLYQFEPDGKFFSQINGYIDPNYLFRKIIGLLNTYK